MHNIMVYLILKFHKSVKISIVFIWLYKCWTQELSEHVEFYSQNEFERFVHLVGFIIKMCFIINCKNHKCKH